MRSLRAMDKRVPRARRLRRDMTEAERKLWWRLRKLPANGSHFRRQAAIGPYYADFACHAGRLVIELDGGHHGDGAQLVHDAQRDAYLKRNGYRVLRFWNNDVLKNIDGVLTVISEAISCSALPPTPDPSPPRASRVGGGEPKRRA
jgi:very-short-patch-repair endonuclease